MHITQKYLDELTFRIIGCAIEVHKQSGPGLLESVCEKCFKEGQKTLVKEYYAALPKI